MSTQDRWMQDTVRLQRTWRGRWALRCGAYAYHAFVTHRPSWHVWIWLSERLWPNEDAL